MRYYPRKHRIIIISALAVLAVGILFAFPPIAQDPAYHNFVDTRAWGDIPNVGDVASNIPFALVGALGLVCLYRRWKHTHSFIDPAKRWFYVIFFVAVMLVAVGSGYYHWAPSNATLVWDRLPMTLGFMSLFTAIIAERIHLKVGLALLPLLLIAGVASVFYWEMTEAQGMGDLRPYIVVQFLPMMLVPAMFWLFEPRYTHTHYFWGILGWYALAKLLEHFDAQVFALTLGLVSGHTLKHLAAAAAAYQVVRWVRDRRKLP